jgi:hypothetical protein
MTTMIGPAMMRSFENATRLGILPTGNIRVRMSANAMPENVAALTTLLCLPSTAHVSGEDFFMMGDQVGRYPQPEMIRTDFNPGGWTLAALEEPDALRNLIGDLPNRFVKLS